MARDILVRIHSQKRYISLSIEPSVSLRDLLEIIVDHENLGNPDDFNIAWVPRDLTVSAQAIHSLTNGDSLLIYPRG